MPLASILVPVFNREGLISRTLQCALLQTVKDIEIIVVDNQSADQTYEVIREMAGRDERIKLFRNAQNLGPVRNWIACAQYASAPYAKLLFSDDLIAPTYLERTLPKILSSGCALVYTPAVVGAEEWKGTVVYRAFDNDCNILREPFLRAAVHLDHFTPVSPSAALFRTADLLNNIHTELPGIDGYDFSRYGAGVDWVVYALTALNYPFVSYVHEPLTFFRAHPGSITIANENNLIPAGYKLAKQWFLSRAISG
jgi:glycosyltransferase involved in cell wall biosynthesis